MKKNSSISFFERYLSLWVLICMFVGIFIGQNIKVIPNFLINFTYAQVSIPIAILIWVMIYPMMMKIDFSKVGHIRQNPNGLFLTWVINWVIKPISMFGFAYLFFFVFYKDLLSPELASDYLAGAILLGAAPCTAMVFVWSQLTKGNPTYTLVQVATNDLIILILFVPIVKILLGIGSVAVPWSTLFISVVMFVVIPLALGLITKKSVTQKHGSEYFQNIFLKKFDKITIIGLLLMLIGIFSMQSELIINNPLHIVLIGIPLIIQTLFIFIIAYLGAYKLKLTHDVAAPAAMIGASNFFELAIAVAVAVFGATSPVALATTVGLLVEVPIMLMLVKVVNNTKGRFN